MLHLLLKSNRLSPPALIIGLLLLTALPLISLHPMDDAYISFRYARNLAQGQGLVWNPGERIEGYSNFLWTFLTAAGMRLGLNPYAAALMLALPLHFISLLLAWRISLKLLGSEIGAGFMVLWLATNPTIFGMTTSGMETPLQMTLFLAVAALFLSAEDKSWTLGRLAFLSGLLGLCILCRPDGAILAVLAIMGCFRQLRPRRFNQWIVLLIPLLLLVLPWLVWKYNYYGQILPNSYYAKVRGIPWGFGLFYIYLFLITHLAFMFAAVTLWQGKKLAAERPILKYFSVLVVVWLAYVVYVGGDFMAYRFIMPIMPMILILMYLAWKRTIAQPKLEYLLIVVLLLGNINAWAASRRVINGWGVETVGGLTDHLKSPDKDWITIGKRLGEYFKGADVRLAVGAAGVIPYYSELYCMDLLGLCDSVVSRHPQYFTVTPGHRIIASVEQVMDRGVNLIIMPTDLFMKEEIFRNWVRSAGWYDVYRFYLDVDQPAHGLPVDEVILIALPIKPGYVLVTWYLTPHPEVDKLIRDNNLGRFVLHRPRRG